MNGRDMMLILEGAFEAGKGLTYILAQLALIKYLLS